MTISAKMHRQTQRIPEKISYSLDSGNRHKGSWTPSEQLECTFSKGLVVFPSDDSSMTKSNEKEKRQVSSTPPRTFKTPPRVNNRYLSSSSTGGTTDDGSSSLQRSVKRTIAKSRRAAIENYKTLASQVTAPTVQTVDDTQDLSNKGSAVKVSVPSFTSYSTWDTNDSTCNDLRRQQNEVVIKATPSAERQLKEGLARPTLSSDDEGDEEELVMATSYVSFSRGIPAATLSSDSDDSGTLFEKVFTCCPPPVVEERRRKS
mmetsp:Transcript_4504/g.6676  ORF Transcript_4504/g.6676 Transcript_4504/m.6676 type:complete len:260 (+) Transcript_4504:228-1007(+)|eukprot:CAMPEP_0172420364 /NCGR_PEP_ID=MMETSP1064-20121228/6735_1 /TAXON_ID=202472 /ORGANISM="Aulacoseira subarctica , Strain CCAP 1002/5" /LENGTH=259 /DNA_ID=CAMNT_0013160291 /DNA_START=220 /DNA_END=999 /DNA_ORIENTATION=+